MNVTITKKSANAKKKLTILLPLVGVICSCSGMQKFEGEGNQENRVADVSKENPPVSSTTAGETNTGNANEDNLENPDLSVAIGTEIHGVNLTGEISLGGSPVAGATVTVAGTECKTVTSLMGQFFLTCSFSYSPETSKLLVETIRDSETITLTLPASDYVVSEITGPGQQGASGGKVESRKTEIPVLNFLLNPSVKSIQVGKWGRGLDRVFGLSTFDGLASRALQSDLQFQSLVHDISGDSEGTSRLFSNCGNLIDSLQSVAPNVSAQLSYADGLAQSSLGLFSNGSGFRRVTFPTAPAVSWACGSAYDTKRNVFWSGSFGGNGSLFYVNKSTAIGTSVAQFVNFTDIAYVKERDELFSIYTIQNLQEIGKMQVFSLGAFEEKLADRTAGQTVVPATEPENTQLLKTREVNLSRAIPLCFRNSLVQFHGAQSVGYLHIIDNVNRVIEGSQNPSPGSQQYQVFHRVYNIDHLGTVTQIYSNVSSSNASNPFQNLIQLGTTPASNTPEILCNASY